MPKVAAQGMRVAVILLVLIAAFPARAAEFSNPEPVEIVGYTGHAMEPFISHDGRCLLFNNLNDPRENTDLHWAERITATSFRYGGKVEGANTKALEGVPLLPAMLHPDRWLLWLGVLFVLSVYFFPVGIVGRLRGRK